MSKGGRDFALACIDNTDGIVPETRIRAFCHGFGNGSFWRLRCRSRSMRLGRPIDRVGRDFALACIDNTDGIVPERITSKLVIQTPPVELVGCRTVSDWRIKLRRTPATPWFQRLVRLGSLNKRRWK
jgi:hypothetical protein